MIRQDMRERFWGFVAERHAIYHARLDGNIPPWTQDPILSTRHFTNVYRELDPGTIYIRRELSLHRIGSLREKVLNVWLYRFALKEESWDELGWQDLSTFNGPLYGDRLGRMREAWKRSGRGSPYHGAYYINNFGSRPIPKHDAIGLMAQEISVALRSQTGRELMAVTNREDWLTVTLGLTGFGDFIANQVLADLSYRGDHHTGLPEDGAVLLGTGARRGLKQLAGLHPDERGVSDTLLFSVLEELWEERREPEPGQPLTRMNLQNCCCEFSKWMRAHATDGSAGLRRGFNADEAWRRDRGPEPSLL